MDDYIEEGKINGASEPIPLEETNYIIKNIKIVYVL